MMGTIHKVEKKGKFIFSSKWDLRTGNFKQNKSAVCFA